MKRKQEQSCVPLQVVRNLTSQVPDIWERVERIRAEKKTSWAEWCYLPMKEGVTLAYSLCGQDQLSSSYYGQQICALAPWRLSKEMFIIDPNLEDELCKQENLSIPTECLMKLPYPCFYIQFQSETMKHFGYDGVFVHLNDEISREHELRLLFTGKTGVTTGLPISLSVKTVTESFKRLLSLSYENIDKIESKEITQFLSGRVRKMVEASTEELLQKTLQLVLYLCAENAEFVPEPSATGRETTPALKDVVTRKDRYSDIRKWDVGVRIGAAIRKYREAKTENPESLDEEVKSETKERTGHASPRPHMRRGHWHHFWTGARKDVEGRKLVLRWIPPTFIGKEIESTPVVLHYESETRTK